MKPNHSLVSGIIPTRREDDIDGTNIDGSSETSSKSPSAYETASEPDTFSIPGTPYYCML